MLADKLPVNPTVGDTKKSLASVEPVTPMLDIVTVAASSEVLVTVCISPYTLTAGSAVIT